MRDDNRRDSQGGRHDHRSLPDPWRGQPGQSGGQHHPCGHGGDRLGARNAVAQHAAGGGWHPGAAGQYRSDPAGGHRGHDRGQPGQIGGHRREGGRLGRDEHHDRRDAERSGGAIAHHRQGALGRPVAAQSVDGVGQAVDVQAAGSQQQHGNNEKSLYGTYDGRDLMFRVTPERMSLYAKGATIPAANQKTGKALGDGLKELDIAYRLATSHVEKLAAADEEYSAGRAVDRLRRLTDLISRMQKGEKRKVNFMVGGKVLPIEIAAVESAVNLALQYGGESLDEAVAALSKLESPK